MIPEISTGYNHPDKWQAEVVCMRNNPDTRDWPIVLTAATGLFLSTLDTGIINVALPTLELYFRMSVGTVSWTITLYLLLLSTTIILFGQMSDRIGQIKVYVLGLFVFGIASVLCGWSMNIIQLIVFRGIQGIGAAMLQATATAIITTTIPAQRRGSALGTLGIMLGLGPILGPSVGGTLLSFIGWRWIFWINVPIVVLGIWGCGYIPQPLATVRNRTKFHLSLFRQPSFTIPLFSVTILGLATAVAFIIPPYFLEQVSKLPPWHAGLVNLAAPLGLVFLSRISGKRINQFGTTRLMVLGLGIMCLSLASLWSMQQSWSANDLFGLLLVYGVGAGIFVPANLSAIMEAVSIDTHGTIGSVQRMVQNIGIAVGTSVSATLIDVNAKYGVSGFLIAFREAWGFAGLLALISLIATAFLATRA